MNSVKTVAVVTVFLGVIYGVYQVINKDSNYVENDDPVVAEAPGDEIDVTALTAEELDAALFGGDDSDPGEEFSADDDFSMDFDLDFGDDSDSDSEPNIPPKPSSNFESERFSSDPPALKQPAQLSPDLSAPQSSTDFGNPTSIPAQFASVAKEAKQDVAELNAEFNSQAQAAVDQSTKAIENSAADLNATIDQTAQKIDQAIPLNSGFSSKAPTDLVPEAVENVASDFNQKANTIEQKVESTNDEFEKKAAELNAEMANTLEGAGAFAQNLASSFAPKVDNNQPTNNPPATTTNDTIAKPTSNSSFDSIGFAPPKQQNLNANPTENFQPQLSQPISVPTKMASIPTGSHDLAAGWDRAKLLIEQNRYREALSSLSGYYNDPRLTANERKNLLSWIDPLAGKVIYSTEHLVTSAHIVNSGNSLSSIADKYKISEELLYNINRSNIPNRTMLTPGMPLKVIEGPFNAVLDLSESRLTLFLDDLYAGHFWVSIGDVRPTIGDFYVQQKSNQGRDYVTASGTTIPAANANNPYGRYWLGLDSNLSIHSSASSGSVEDTRGCISLSPIDAEDVFGILTVGSRLQVRE